ncbi:hypothetical protein HYH03_018169 [Edaphochlamys debaryana]|uniref:Uncharacterized protein n=1 Tax=Edaphochlamys debaryana TaxID=47281 RepID=A0A835XMM3_9CHLO|nr:hypothetical protein HYH03_018169 [Edaphochlamys debaryana]|eukprot:KAG2482944.1 hypothetical protein HYH03_018169 [Edaphochlamys debaryana]
MTRPAVAVPPQAPRVRYVYVPADNTEPISEREIEVPEGREVECLLDTLKAHFRLSGGTKTAAQLAAQREQLIAQVGPQAAALSADMLAAALDMQMVESVPLLTNTPASGYVGVNLYCDDQAQVKELPLNARASAISDCCGRPLQVRGDAFVARVFDNEDHFVRLDLGLGEVTSSAPWVAAAAAQAAARLQGGDRAAAFVQQLQGRQGQGQGGKQEAAKATVRELTPAEAAKEEGNAAAKRGDWAAAAEAYGAALAADPSLLAAANNRALAFLRLGRSEEAEADCCTVLAAEPANAKALLRRAAARRALGRMEGAVEDLRAVLALEPRNKEAAAELAALLPPPPPPPAQGAAEGEAAEAAEPMAAEPAAQA